MGIIMLLVGVILIGAGVIAYVVIGQQSPEGIEGLPDSVNLETVQRIVQYGVGGLLAGLGAIFSLCGLGSLARRSKQRQLAERLMHTGMDAEGTVTFVDKNWRIQVNQRPIYSIVEYTYQDANGGQHTRRVEDISSEIVIRKQIQVGSKIAVKYAREDPSKSIMVLG
jgi:hypothetical protein